MINVIKYKYIDLYYKGDGWTQYLDQAFHFPSRASATWELGKIKARLGRDDIEILTIAL